MDRNIRIDNYIKHFRELYANNHFESYRCLLPDEWGEENYVYELYYSEEKGLWMLEGTVEAEGYRCEYAIREDGSISEFRDYFVFREQDDEKLTDIIRFDEMEEFVSWEFMDLRTEDGLGAGWWKGTYDKAGNVITEEYYMDY